MRAGYTGLKMGLTYMCVIGATFVLFPHAYFDLFRPKNAGFTAEEMLGLGRNMLLLLVTVSGLLDTVSIVLSGALKGAGDTRFVMIYMIIGSWLMLVPGALLLLWAGVGILGLWGWLAAYMCVLAEASGGAGDKAIGKRSALSGTAPSSREVKLPITFLRHISASGRAKYLARSR